MKKAVTFMDATRSIVFSVEEEVLAKLFEKASNFSKETGKTASEFVNALIKKALEQES